MTSLYSFKGKFNVGFGLAFVLGFFSISTVMAGGSDLRKSHRTSSSSLKKCFKLALPLVLQGSLIPVISAGGYSGTRQPCLSQDDPAGGGLASVVYSQYGGPNHGVNSYSLGTTEVEEETYFEHPARAIRHPSRGVLQIEYTNDTDLGSFLVSSDQPVYVAQDESEKFDSNYSKTKLADEIRTGDHLWSEAGEQILVTSAAEIENSTGVSAPDLSQIEHPVRAEVLQDDMPSSVVPSILGEFVWGSPHDQWRPKKWSDHQFSGIQSPSPQGLLFIKQRKVGAAGWAKHR